MPRMLMPVCVFLSLSLIAAVESRPQQKLGVDVGPDRIVLEDLDSYALKWWPLVDFEQATLRVTGKQGPVWERQFQAGDTLDYDLLDLAGVPLPDGSYTFEWRLTVISSDAESGMLAKTQSGRFQVREGAARSLAKPSTEAEVPRLTNPSGNHFVGNLTTDSDLCVGCVDGASADVTLQEARIRSRGASPGIILHEKYTYGDEYWMIQSTGGDFLIVDLPSGTETGNEVPFWIEDRAPWNAFRIASSGDIGLGIATPQAALHVADWGGKAKLLVEEMSSSVAVRTLFQLKNNGAPRFALENTNSGIEWSFQQSGPGNFLISKDSTGGPEMQVYTNGRVRMGPGGVRNFDLDPSGNLQIKGTLTAGADGTTFPDYVFEPDYALMPLSDLRSFVQIEKRLPGIPAAEEVQNQGGHNMTELQLKLLEKIEELTLYTLDQEKRLQEQAEKLREMTTLKERLAAIETLLSDR